MEAERAFLKREQQRMERRMLKRSVECLVSHALAVVRQRVFLKTEASRAVAKVIKQHNRVLEERNGRIRQLESDIANDTSLKSMHSQLEEMRWMFRNQPGVPSNFVKMVDPSKVCLSCKRQVVFQQHLHGVLTDVETLRKIPGSGDTHRVPALGPGLIKHRDIEPEVVVRPLVGEDPRAIKDKEGRSLSPIKVDKDSMRDYAIENTIQNRDDWGVVSRDDEQLLFGDAQQDPFVKNSSVYHRGLRVVGKKNMDTLERDQSAALKDNYVQKMLTNNSQSPMRGTRSQGTQQSAVSPQHTGRSQQAHVTPMNTGQGFNTTASSSFGHQRSTNRSQSPMSQTASSGGQVGHQQSLSPHSTRGFGAASQQMMGSQALASVPEQKQLSVRAKGTGKGAASLAVSPQKSTATQGGSPSVAVSHFSSLRSQAEANAVPEEPVEKPLEWDGMHLRSKGLLGKDTDPSRFEANAYQASLRRDNEVAEIRRKRAEKEQRDREKAEREELERQRREMEEAEAKAKAEAERRIKEREELLALGIELPPDGTGVLSADGQLHGGDGSLETAAEIEKSLRESQNQRQDIEKRLSELPPDHLDVEQYERDKQGRKYSGFLDINPQDYDKGPFVWRKEEESKPGKPLTPNQF